MTRFCSIILSSLLVLATTGSAQLPEAPIEAMIEVGSLAPFERETFQILLTIITRGVEIRQQLDLANLPDASRISIIGGFEALPIERKVDGPTTIETRRYRARARGMASGATTIAPLLRLTAQRRTRSFFGNMIEEHPVSIQIQGVTVSVKPLPPAPGDFCGAIGVFAVDISASPTRLVAGDLVTVATLITGEGYLEDLRMPMIQEAPLLKAYPVKEVQRDPQQRRFAQTIIPKSDAVTEIPVLRLTLFDTGKGAYVTHTAGPFPLRYQETRTRVVEHFRPDDQDDPGRSDGNGDRPAASLRQRLIAGRQVTGPVAIETNGRMAPSFASRATFAVPTGSEVQILEHHRDWILIEYRGNRGWIHETAFATAAEAGSAPDQRISPQRLENGQ